MRGEVFAYQNPNARGHEQAGRRFAVVVQTDDLPLSTLLVAPTSTKVAATDFRAQVDVMGRTTHVLTEHTTAINPERLGTSVGYLSYTEMRAVDECLRRVLDIT